jgi:pyroglutamyl-peptidase
VLGFQPFDGHAQNPSQLLVEALRQERPGLAAEVLPVSAAYVAARVPQLLAERAPRAVLAFGLGAGAEIAIERVAVNLCDFRIPDADGRLYQDAPVIEGGPAAYFSTVPTRKMCEALQREGIPARLSLSAGAYLCNFLLYSLLYHAARGPASFCAGFVHLPALPGMRGDGHLPFADMQRAARLLLESCEVAT